VLTAFKALIVQNLIELNPRVGFITCCQSDEMNSKNFAQPVSNLQTQVDQVDEAVLAAHFPIQSQFHGAPV
jgi:hypothetical protein